MNWRKSSRSINHGDCVEVAVRSSVIAVRDTTQAGNTNHAVLAFSAGAWREFIASLR